MKLTSFENKLRTAALSANCRFLYGYHDEVTNIKPTYPLLRVLPPEVPLAWGDYTTHDFTIEVYVYDSYSGDSDVLRVDKWEDINDTMRSFISELSNDDHIQTLDKGIPAEYYREGQTAERDLVVRYKLKIRIFCMGK